MNLKSAFCISAAMSATFGFSQVPVTKLTSILAPNAISYSTNLGPLNPAKLIHFTVSLPPTSMAKLQALADSVSDPGSPSFRHYTTPQTIATDFGQPLTTVQTIANYLTSKGLTVTYISPSHFTMTAQGTVGNIESAFGTTLNQFHSTKAVDADKPYFYSFTSPLQVPTSIAPYIEDVAGLQNYTRMKKFILTPDQARVLYGTAPDYNSGFQGQGRSVAISSWDGYLLSNVPLYFAKYGLPGPPSITQIKINGGSGTGTAQGEGDVDIQMVLGMAPRCNFYIYDGGLGGGGSDLLDVLSREQTDNLADIISESYGWAPSPTEQESAHVIHTAMTAQGITYMAASGDSGTDHSPFGILFDYPIDDPEVLQVGATEATTSLSGTRVSEITWSGNGAGGGGWVTTPLPFNIKPSWQKGTGVPNVNFRLGPDVAIMGGFINNLGAYFFFFAGALDSTVAGTSFACPVFAGQLAVTEQRVIATGGLKSYGGHQRAGRIQDVFYAQNGTSTKWYDVVGGGSIGLLPDGSTALPKPGWDFATGWGAINWHSQTLKGLVSLPMTPTLVGVVEGTNLGMPSSNVIVADGQYFEIANETVANIGQVASASFSFTLPTTVSRASVQNLLFNFAGGFAQGSTGQIYLLNWVTGKWDILKSFPLGATGTTLNTKLSSNMTTYMSAAGQYRILVRGIQPVSAGVTTNSLNLDLVGSTVQYADPNG